MRIRSLARPLLLLSFYAALSGGCAITMNMPVVRFESPEAQGELGKGFVGVGYAGDNDLTVVSDTTSASLSDARTFSPSRVVSLLFGMGLLERLDLGFRSSGSILGPLTGAAPTVLGLKYQLLGAPRATAQPGQFALALSAGGGWKSQQKTDSDSFTSISATSEAKFTQWDLALIGGYRFSPSGLVYSSLFHAPFHYSATVVQSGTGANPPFTVEGDATQTGVSLGLELSWKYLLTRLEGAYAVASSGGAVSRGIWGGGMIGAQW
jgi:hypothetical protein